MTFQPLHRFAFALLFALPAQAFETITFESEDGLAVTADLYQEHPDKTTPFILLFHQAGFSRGEYREIAPRLNALGFNAMAVDQRSGNAVNGISNETAKVAKAANQPTGFLDAEQDMRAAIAYARENHANGSVIGWGSSYSSSLILKLAAETPGLVDGTLSFSPGEYFSPNNLIANAVPAFEGAIFITSARGEANGWKGIFDAASNATRVSFIPTTSGNHGSRALWDQFSDSESYWTAVEDYLSQWLVPASSELLTVSTVDGAIEMTVPALSQLYVSQDLISWTAIGSTSAEDKVVLDFEQIGTEFYRTEMVESPVVADITAVTANGSAGAYSFSVTIESPDLGCEQYADWWEVLREDGTLLYRRILTHSHVNEQPFTRSGGSVDISPDETVIIRAHMNQSGFGGKIYSGSVAGGFAEADVQGTFAPWTTQQSPLPNGCAF